MRRHQPKNQGKFLVSKQTDASQQDGKIIAQVRCGEVVIPADIVNDADTSAVTGMQPAGPLQEPVRMPVTDASQTQSPQEGNSAAAQAGREAAQANNDPVAEWVAQAPEFRQPEVDFLASFSPGLPMTVTESGELQKPFAIDEWVYMIQYSKEFPSRTESGVFPARVFLVAPSAEELFRMTGQPSLPQVYVTEDKSEFIYMPNVEMEHVKLLSGEMESTVAESLVAETAKWMARIREDARGRIPVPGSQVPKVPSENDAFNLARWKEPKFKMPFSSGGDYEQYTDARESQGRLVNPKCRKVVLSKRAAAQILTETEAHIDTETGGLLLGHYENGVWYVIEVSNPGAHAIYDVAYHEADEDEQNYIALTLSRQYKHRLVHLGMYHRHPASFDQFSQVDHACNNRYASACGNGCLSFLVNYDPDFRLTTYYVEQGHGYDGKVYYSHVDYVVSDEEIPEELLQIADYDDIMSRRNNQ